jgi:ApbE superfamily uncharacterized protein (UPF0280 family)
MYFELGPVGLDITGQKEGRSLRVDTAEVETCVRVALEELRNCLPILRQKAHKLNNIEYIYSIAKKMVEAVKLVDGQGLTPMAAVAGAVADVVKARLKEEGAEIVLVNNGGDISLYNGTERTLRVGIGDIRKGRATRYSLNISGLREYGLATSGFGGRSLTLGLADMVTVVAGSGAIADAAATFLCNRTNVESKAILRKRGSEVDPSTDIPDDYVTVHVGDLEESLVQRALENGLRQAQRLKESRCIYEAVILFRDGMATTIGGDKNVVLEVHHENQKDCYGS